MFPSQESEITNCINNTQFSFKKTINASYLTKIERGLFKNLLQPYEISTSYSVEKFS